MQKISAGKFHFDPPRSFDHLVGEREQLVGDTEAERLRGFEVNDQLELGWLDDRQVCWLFAFEAAPGIAADLAPRFGLAGSIADQSASRGKFAVIVHRRKRMARGQLDDLLAPGGKEWNAENNKRIWPLLGEGGEPFVNLAVCAGLKNIDLLAECTSGILQVLQLARAGQKVRVHERGDRGRSRKQLMQQAQSLRLQCTG